jgi:hypothetical protein
MNRCSILAFFVLILIGSPVRAQLVNPNATPEALALKHLLDSVSGQKIISGQCDDSYLQYIQDVTGGKSPALMGYDFNGICPSQGGNNDAAKAIQWVKTMGGIAQFQWHWISPNADGDWSSHNFNLGNALADTAGLSYHNMIRDIDRVSAEMKKMQDSGIAILWRPLHEAEGQWFWWGYSGGDACKQLYRLMYDRMVNVHHLNNLIWIWNSYGTDKQNWYPGDDVVDIIAWDYPNYSGSNSSWNQYQSLFANNGKLFGIGEDGKLTDPEILASQPWLYFMTWAYMIKDKNTADWVNQVYNDSRVITLDDLVPGPKAKAGRGQLVFDTDGDGFETVSLDGSASSTDSGTIVSWVWSENGITIASGPVAAVSLSVGIHTITLTITTSTGATATGNVVITVKSPSLSLNKPAVASSTEANLGNVVGNAVDGNSSTRWSSTYSDPQWYRIDLGKKYTITGVVLSWEVASAKEYKIEVSDNGTDWTNVITKTDMPAGARTDQLLNLSAQGRYIRMYGIKRNTTYGYSIYEFEVYGNSASGMDDPVQGSIKIFPSVIGPDRILTIQTVENLTNSSIQICNASGKIMMQKNYFGQEMNLKLDTRFRPGLYVVRIRYGNTLVNKEFIVV